MKSTTPTPRTFRGLPAIALALAALGLSQPAARGEIITSDDTIQLSAGGDQDNASVVDQWTTAKGSAPVDTANDLLKNHATVSMSAPKLGLGDSLSYINDGSMLSGGHTSGQTDGLCLFTSDGAWVGSGPVDLVFTLDNAYNIERIDGFTLWDLSRLGQYYELYASTDGGANWNLVTTVNKDATGSDGNRYIRRISLTDSGGVITGLVGVNALKFHIMDPGPYGATSNNSIYAEIAAYAAAAPTLADAGASTVEASPTTVASDGVNTSTITVTLKDSGGTPVPGKTVSLAKFSGLGSPTIEPISGTTNGSGIATFTVKCATADTYQFEATDTSDSVTVAQKASVTFSASAVSPANSTVTAAPPSVVANGTSTSTITVTLKNASNTAVSGKTVSLAKTSGPGSPVIAPASIMTNGSGIATFTVTSTTIGSCVFTATDATDGITIGTTGVTFEAGPVLAGISTVTASPTTVAADGVAISTITVTLKDQYGNPVPGKDVSVAATSGPVIAPAPATTNGSGVATFTVTSTTTGEFVFTATDITDGNVEINPSTATVTFVHVTAVTWAETNLDVSTFATGIEIANDGTLVRAYHFGNAAAITDITVHGVFFTNGGSAENGLTDTAMGGQWVGGWSGWNGEWSLASITDPDCKQLISCMIMASSTSTITIGGLTVGHTYRLQLISNNPRNGQIGVEGATHTLSGGDNANPVLLAATWVADDDTLNMSMLNNDMHFNAYALHDLTGGATPTPTIASTGSPLTTSLTTTYGTASTATSFSVSGAGMTAGITVTPPLGFEVSTTSDFTSNVGNNSSPITVGSSGTIASTPVHVRLAANAPVAGAYDAQNIVLSSAGATSVNVTTAASGNTVSRASSSVTATGTTTFPYNRSPQGPASADVTGSTGITSYSYEGTGTTTYAASPTQPTNAGTYAVTATVAEDANYHTASSTPLGFTITPNFASWIDFYTSIPLLDRDPGDDPDQDGQTNEDEYAFGLIPNNGASSNPISVQLNKTTGKFTYTRRNPELTGIVYSILTSTTLADGVQPGDWAIDATATQTPSGDGELQTVEVTLGGTKPLGATKLFVRVMAVVPAQ